MNLWQVEQHYLNPNLDKLVNKYIYTDYKRAIYNERHANRIAESEMFKKQPLIHYVKPYNKDIVGYLEYCFILPSFEKK